MPKILAVVKLNQGEALVLDKDPELIYTKYGDDTIIGTDGIFYSFYGYQRYSTGNQAFGGSKFTLTLDTGEVVECNGQWWDSITQTTIKVLGINKTDKQVVYATANSVANLKRCYVYMGYKGLSDNIKAFRKTYTGYVWDYWDYESIIKGRRLKKKSRKKIRNHFTNQRTIWYKAKTYVNTNN